MCVYEDLHGKKWLYTYGAILRIKKKICTPSFPRCYFPWGFNVVTCKRSHQHVLSAPYSRLLKCFLCAIRRWLSFDSRQKAVLQSTNKTRQPSPLSLRCSSSDPFADFRPVVLIASVVILLDFLSIRIMSSANQRLLRNYPSISTSLFSQFYLLAPSSFAVNRMWDVVSLFLYWSGFSHSLCGDVTELSVYISFRHIFYSLFVQCGQYCLSLYRVKCILVIHERNSGNEGWPSMMQLYGCSKEFTDAWLQYRWALSRPVWKRKCTAQQSKSSEETAVSRESNLGRSISRAG